MYRYRSSVDAPVPRLRCSQCGDTSPYVRWIPGGYWRSGSFLCDSCVQAESVTKCLVLIFVVGIVVLPIVLWIVAVLVSLVQVLVLH